MRWLGIGRGRERDFFVRRAGRIGVGGAVETIIGFLGRSGRDLGAWVCFRQRGGWICGDCKSYFINTGIV